MTNDYSHLYDFNGDIFKELGYHMLSLNKMTQAKDIFTFVAKNFPGQRSPMLRLLVSLVDDNPKVFDKLVEEFAVKGAAKVNVKESELNSLGYRLISLKRLDSAVKVFSLNVKLFPGSANVYDSLGEACLKKGYKAAAITNYKKALKLKPDNMTVKSLLEKLMKE